MDQDKNSISLAEWLAIPSPSDCWLYRGQPAKYQTVIPSRRRSGQPSYKRALLYEANLVLGTRIGASLSGFALIKPEHTLLPFQGRTSSFDNSYQPIQLVRAITQHYLHSTDFIDLTFDPAVALFFGSHRSENGVFVQDTDDVRIFRWPAKRINKLYLSVESVNRALRWRG